MGQLVAFVLNSRGSHPIFPVYLYTQLEHDSLCGVDTILSEMLLSNLAANALGKVPRPKRLLKPKVQGDVWGTESLLETSPWRPRMLCRRGSRGDHK